MKFCEYQSGSECLRNPLLFKAFGGQTINCSFTVEDINYDEGLDELYISKSGERVSGECVDFNVLMNESGRRGELECKLRDYYRVEALDLERAMLNFKERDERVIDYLALASAELANDYQFKPLFLYYRAYAELLRDHFDLMEPVNL